MKYRIRMFSAFILSLILFVVVQGYNNGLAETPPMGWNTWCTEDWCGARDVCNE